jgi:genome maintenance exonuclease 1
MQWNNKFAYPKSMRSMVNGSRMYAVNQEKLPSVTSILQATQSEEKKASLANWKARVGTVEANRIKNDASSRGTSMHAFLEKYLLGQLNLELLEEQDNKSKKMADEIIEQGIKNKLSEIWGTEATLYYPGKYAGTCDACGVYEGQETIIDFKQSNKPKKEEWIEDYYLQLGAYSLAHNIVYNSRITQGIVLLCTVDNLFQDFRIQGVKLEEYQNKFLEKVEQFYHQRNMN